jgi:hypothetical protein
VKRKPDVLEYGWTRKPIDAANLTPAQLKELREYAEAVQWARRAMGMLK